MRKEDDTVGKKSSGTLIHSSKAQWSREEGKSDIIYRFENSIEEGDAMNGYDDDERRKQWEAISTVVEKLK